MLEGGKEGSYITRSQAASSLFNRLADRLPSSFSIPLYLLSPTHHPNDINMASEKYVHARGAPSLQCKH